MNGYPQSVSYGGQQVMPQGLAPQGLFGGMLGGPVGGMIGRGIGGWLGNPALGAQIGQIAGGIGGSLLPFQSDPMAAYAQQLHQLQQLQQLQQQQGLTPQGFFGNLLGQIGQPLGNAIGGIFGHSGLGSTIGSAASHLGRLLPFQADPMMAAYAQQLAQQQAQQLAQQQGQQQLAPQGFFGNLLGQIGQPLGSAIGGIFGQSGLGGTIGGAAGQLGRLLPFQVDPMTAAYSQQIAQQQAQQHLAPQGFFGNLLGQIGQPLGSAIGGIWGNQGLGSNIGNIAGQIGRMLPFQMDPMQQAAWAQQLAQQQQQLPYQSYQAYPGSYQGGYQGGYQGAGQQAYTGTQQTLH